jgi:GntR family transcriptional repressor for pyruvate dehydrogenase complex
MMRLSAKMEAGQHARPVRTHERVSGALLGKLFRGDIAPGEKLPTERTLARDFDVNRATVREALRYLENLELVAIRQGDGAYVKPLLESGNLEIAKAMVRIDPSWRREVLAAIHEIRRINGPEMAYAAALNRSPAHLQHLETLALRPEGSHILERDKRIHRVIAQASGNILLILLTNFCMEFFDDFGDLYFAREANVRRSEQFHRSIYEAIRDQNAGVAREVMRDVLAYAEQAVREELEKAGPPAESVERPAAPLNWPDQ